MLLVIPVHPGDVALAIRRSEWCFELDGQQQFDSLIFAEQGTNIDALKVETEKAFRSVKVVFCPKWEGDKTWPMPQNHAWKECARLLETLNERWYWWEPDVIPLRAGWLVALSIQYEASKKEFMGHVVRNGPASPYMNGAGFYPERISRYTLRPFMAHAHPFDQVMGSEVMPITHDASDLMGHAPKNDRSGYRFDTFADVESRIAAENVVWHGCSDGSLIDVLRAARKGNIIRKAAKAVQKWVFADKPGKLTFYHSGDLGDIIYALPTIRALGGGKLFLGPDSGKPPFITREKMDKHRCELIAPLIRQQHYISDVEYAPIQPKVDFDLNQFRTIIHRDIHENLAYVHLKHFGKNISNAKAKWLRVDFPIKIDGKEVVFARSQRYHNPQFEWKRIVEEYRSHAVFIGSRSEHSEFEREFGHVDYFPTGGILDAARLVSGCSLFVGNQSSPYAVAEGLKVNTIQESWDGAKNCIFTRYNAHYSIPTRLPSMSRAHTNPKQRILIKGVMDDYSGLGQVFMRVLYGLADAGRKVAYHPTRQTWVASRPTRLGKLTKLPDSGDYQILCEAAQQIPKFINKGDTVFTMWEASVWPNDVVASLNNNASLIMVPCKWNQECLKESGCDVPITVVPLGIDTKKFSPNHNLATVAFGAEGCIVHGEERKNLSAVIKAFKVAFPNGEDVKLSIKTSHNDPKMPIDDPRITQIREFMSEDGIIEWHQKNRVFVSASRAEGWNLCLHEAMSCGAIPVACIYGGQAEFFDASVGIPVDFTITQTSGHYSNMGEWCDPDIASLANAMKKAFNQNNVGFTAARNRAVEFDTSNMIKKIEEAIGV